MNISNIWNTMVRTIDKSVAGSFVISLPVLSTIRENTLLCFVLPIQNSGMPLLGRPIYWCTADLIKKKLTVYDCKVRDFCNISYMTGFKGYLCIDDGIDALNSCLLSLTTLLSQDIEDGNNIRSSSVALSRDEVDSYNRKVLSLTTPVFTDIYKSLMRQ